MPKHPSILPKTAKQVKPRHWITPSGVHYITVGKSWVIFGGKTAKALLRKQRKK